MYIWCNINNICKEVYDWLIQNFVDCDLNVDIIIVGMYDIVKKKVIDMNMQEY